MNCKLAGRVQSGSYAGQDYRIIGKCPFPRWVTVRLTDEYDWNAVREVREQDLEEN